MVRDVTFSVRAGEIVGLAGLVGAGRTEIVRAIAGADVPDRGEIAVDGERVRVRAPEDGIHAGIAFITEDRKAQGLVFGMTVRENITLAHLSEFVNRDRLIDRRGEREAAAAMIAELRIRTPGASRSSAIFRAAISRRSCSQNGCSARLACFCSTSRRAVSTSVRRPRFTT